MVACRDSRSARGAEAAGFAGGTRQQPARNLEPGRLRLGWADEAPRALGLDLVELIAIDGERAGIGHTLGPLLESGPREGGQHGSKDSSRQ